MGVALGMRVCGRLSAICGRIERLAARFEAGCRCSVRLGWW